MNLQYERTVEAGTVQYTAIITNLQTFSGREIELVKAKHFHGYGKQHVTHARITSSYTYVIPGIGNHYINLSTLVIDKCGLKEISKKDFLLLSGLKALYLTNNLIASLPADLFELTPQLTELSLRENKIRFISKHTLTPLTSLKFADLSRNMTIDEIYDSNAKVTTSGITLCSLRTKIFEQCKPPNEQVSSVASYMHSLLQGLFSDFKIKVNEEIFEVHKAVLAANSPVFAAMFSHEMEENITNEMTIENFPAETVKELLAFVYVREVPKKSFSTTDLYAMAQEFQIKELSGQIQWYISMEVSGENASEIFKLGVLYNDEIIKQAAFRALEKSLNRKLPKYLLESDEALIELLDIKDKLDEVLKRIDLIETIPNFNLLVNDDFDGDDNDGDDDDDDDGDDDDGDDGDDDDVSDGDGNDDGDDDDHDFGDDDNDDECT